MDWLNYHHLLYFWMVAKEGSIVKACEKLHLSQPTISNQLKALEQSIGKPLFQKSGRNLVMTEMGQIVFRFADEIFTVGQDLQHFLSGQSQESTHRQRLTIGITDSFPKTVSFRILEPLIAIHDYYRFVCLEDDDLDGLLIRLSQYELDLVLADAPVAPQSKIKAYNHLLGSSKISFLATPDLAAKYRDHFPYCLKDAPILLPSDTTALRRELEAYFTRLDLYPHIIGEFDDMALMKVFGQRGTGIFTVPSVIAEDVCHNLGVECIGEAADDVRSSFYAISMQRRIRQETIMHLIERARKHLF